MAIMGKKLDIIQVEGVVSLLLLHFLFYLNFWRIYYEYKINSATEVA